MGDVCEQSSYFKYNMSKKKKKKDKKTIETATVRIFPHPLVRQHEYAVFI